MEMRNEVDIIYKIVAMKRSGHHAIIEWIIENMDGEIYYLNNINKGSAKSTNLKNLKPIKKNGDNKILFYNIEDYDPDQNFNINITGTNIINLHIIRDPLNLFASRIKINSHPKHKGKQWFTPAVIKLYKKHFNLLLKNDFYTINYTRWVEDIEYKNSVANFLKIKNNNSLKKLSLLGHSISFAASSFNKNTDNITLIKFNERYKTLNKNNYNKILNTLPKEVEYFKIK